MKVQIASIFIAILYAIITRIINRVFTCMIKHYVDQAPENNLLNFLKQQAKLRNYLKPRDKICHNQNTNKVYVQNTIYWYLISTKQLFH